MGALAIRTRNRSASQGRWFGEAEVTMTNSSPP